MVTIGADPEVFIKDSRTGGVVPVCGLIGGTKEAPKDMGGGYFVQEDNVMLEFNIPPAGDSNQFYDNITTGLAKCKSLLTSIDSNLELDKEKSSRLFSDDQLSSREANLFGCAADFTAYEQGGSLPVLDVQSLVEQGYGGQWRFAGGHIHLGYDNPHDIPDFVVAAFADIYLGLMYNKDNQGKRRELYGTAGRYRPTSYGIEYRTLSNRWLFDEEWAFHLGTGAVNLGNMIEHVSEDALQTAYKELPWDRINETVSQGKTGNEPRRLRDFCKKVMSQSGIDNHLTP